MDGVFWKWETNFNQMYLIKMESLCYAKFMNIDWTTDTQKKNIRKGSFNI